MPNAWRAGFVMKRIARVVESGLFGSRWLVVPFLFGLVLALVALLYKFVLKLVDFVVQVPAADVSTVLVGALGLVDLTLAANLIVIVISSSYDNFVAPVGQNPAWPNGLVNVGFAGLKHKLLGSIVAIAAVSALEWFMDIDRNPDSVKLAWVVGTLVAFALAMLLAAIADRLSAKET